MHELSDVKVNFLDRASLFISDFGLTFESVQVFERLGHLELNFLRDRLITDRFSGRVSLREKCAKVLLDI